ncbi:hypothetical protein ABEF95_009585 [Exophiala dermatitidis]
MTTYGAGIPRGYQTPRFPALYWPIRANPGEPQYLYHYTDIYLFTLYWTMITIGAAHVCVAAWAVLMQFHSAAQRRKYLSTAEGRRLSAKNRKLLGEKPIGETLGWVWLVPVTYIVLGGLEALLAGTLVGLVLGAVYNAGYFRMSTWTPLFWGVINMLVLVVSSFRIQGGL